MESCRWPATLKEEKRPLATQNPYFHSGDGDAAGPVIGNGQAWGGTRAMNSR
jgi:hypothetical protein